MKIQAEDLITIGYLSCVGTLVALFYDRVQGAWFHLALHILWIGGVVGVVWKSSTTPTPLWLHVRTWYHLVSIPLAFRELHYLVHPINPKDLDPVFVEWDLKLLGVHPTVWLERIMHPILTEYLQMVYSTFYFLPLVLGYILWRQNRWDGFRAALVGAVTTFYVSYLGYFAFPALGPRFEIEHLQTRPLEGVWLTNKIREILDSLELIQRDAFPSGHVGVTVLLLYYAWRYCSRKTACAYGIVAASMVFSTVYLRYHYVVDVIAGLALSVVSGVLAASLRRLLPHEVTPWSYKHIQTRDRS